MKVAIDARALLPPATGIGTYTRGIAGALASRAGVEVRLFTPRPLPESEALGPWSVGADRRSPGTLWVQTTLPRRARQWGADVLLAALTIGPVRGGLPFVSVVHDLTAVTHPEWHALRTLVGFAPLWDRTAEKAARFVCVSEATARELERAHPETRARVRVVANGVDPDFAPAPDGPALAATRRATPAGTGTSCTWARSSRARTSRLSSPPATSSGAAARRRPISCSPAGAGWKTSALFDRIARSPFREKIHLAGYANREAARELYQAADVFVYPSLEEGFGLPVLEAMACGIPVVASTAEALREVAGGAALFAEPRDSAGFAREIERALEDPATRRRLAAAGPVRAAGFSWEAAGQATAAVLAEAAGETPP